MSKELAKTYDPKQIEEKMYEKWCENKYFHAEVDRSKKPFTTVMPPPNITGKLHMGHALDNTLQDILIRYKRMEFIKDQESSTGVRNVRLRCLMPRWSMRIRTDISGISNIRLPERTVSLKLQRPVRRHCWEILRSPYTRMMSDIRIL